MGNNKNRRKNKLKKHKKKTAHKIIKTDENADTNEVSKEAGENETIENERVPRKREHSGEDSDVEEKPKMKKKKKSLPVEGSVQVKGKKSIRQLKREKFAQRQVEAEASAKDTLKQQCLSYLSQWKHTRDQWKFMKAKQVWLYKNKFSSKLLPNDSWPLLLEYFESAKGNIRNMLLDDANKIIKKMDECIERDSDTENNADEIEDSEQTPTGKPDETSYKRARDIIQHLQE